jgi:hypothetical protein
MAAMRRNKISNSLKVYLMPTFTLK